jgi:HlyD family secretion protein
LRRVREEARAPVKIFIRVISTLLVLGSLAGAAAWVYRSTRVQAKAELPSATARKGEFQVIVRCRGELMALRSVQLIAPINVPGLQIAWQAPANSEVKAGDLVVKFDSSSSQQQLLEKQAALKQAQAALDQAITETRTTAQQDKLDTANAQVNVDKMTLEASKEEIVSRLQAEESRIDLGVAEQKLRAQEATDELHSHASDGKIASLKRQRDKAQQDIDVTNERLAKMEMHAPSSGVVVYLNNYSQGWINAKPFKVGDQVWGGSGIAELPDLSTLALKGKLEEIDRGRIAVGQDVRITVDPFPEKIYNGKLSAISPLVEQSFDWPPTRNFRATGGFNEHDSRLRPGMNGRLDITIERIPDAVSIPAAALFTHLGRPTVYVEDASGWKAREVQVIARNPDEVAIKGIEGGTKIALAEPDAPPKPGESKAK